MRMQDITIKIQKKLHNSALLFLITWFEDVIRKTKNVSFKEFNQLVLIKLVLSQIVQYLRQLLKLSSY